MVNIFDIISQVNARSEPVHSRYLAAVLKESAEGDGQFLRAFWNRAVALPNDSPAWASPPTALDVCPEDQLRDARIDIVIHAPAARLIVGIEIKTSDLSVEYGQLNAYLELLREKYAGYDIRMVYLTPFNRDNPYQARDLSMRSRSLMDSLKLTDW